MDMAVDWLLLGVTRDTTVSTVQGAVDMLAGTRVTTVRASLARSTIRLATEAADKLHVLAVFDANWDPLKIEENVKAHDIVEKKEELFALAKAAEAKIENYKPGQYIEHEGSFESRVQHALCQRFNSFQVVLLVPAVMQHCAGLLGDFSSPSVLLLRSRGEPSSLPERVGSFPSNAVFVDRLLSLPLRDVMKGMYNLQEVDFGPDLSYSITADIERNRPCPEFCRTPVEINYSTKHSERISEEMKTVTREFESQLKKSVAGLVSSGYPRQEDIDAEHRANLTLTAFTERLDKWHQDADSQVKAITGEAETIIREEKAVAEEMKSTVKSQRELRAALSNLKEVVPVAVGKLSEKVESLEKRIKEQQTAVAEISAKYRTRRPVYTLKNERIIDTQVTAEVDCLKPYFIPGTVQIFESGNLHKEFPLSLNDQRVIVLGTFMEFTVESFSVLIRDSQGNLISNEVRIELASVSIPRRHATENTEANYINSMLYKQTGNMEEIEKEIVDKAQQAGLNLFKRLVCEWENEESDRANDFILACLDKLQDGEEATKAKLRAEGFKLR